MFRAHNSFLAAFLSGSASSLRLCVVDLDFVLSAIVPLGLCPFCHISTFPGRIWQTARYFSNKYTKPKSQSWCLTLYFPLVTRAAVSPAGSCVCKVICVTAFSSSPSVSSLDLFGVCGHSHMIDCRPLSSPLSLLKADRLQTNPRPPFPLHYSLFSPPLHTA